MENRKLVLVTMAMNLDPPLHPTQPAYLSTEIRSEHGSEYYQYIAEFFVDNFFFAAVKEFPIV